MNRIAALLLTASLAILAGCANHLPKPTNANGTFNPSVAVAEAKITYTNLARDAKVYVTTCHTTPTTIGCNESLVTQIKVANDRAFNAVNSAEVAVKTLPAGATGIDAAIADMNAALIFLQSFVTQTKHPSTGMVPTLHILEGVLA